MVSDRFSRGEGGNRGMSYYRNILPLSPTCPTSPILPPQPLLSFQAFTKPNPNKQLLWQVVQRGLRHKRARHKSWFSNEKRKGKERKGDRKDCNASTRESGVHETIPQPTLLQSQPKYIYPDRKRTGGSEKYIYIYSRGTYQTN